MSKYLKSNSLVFEGSGSKTLEKFNSFEESNKKSKEKNKEKGIEKRKEKGKERSKEKNREKNNEKNKEKNKEESKEESKNLKILGEILDILNDLEPGSDEYNFGSTLFCTLYDLGLNLHFKREFFEKLLDSNKEIEENNRKIEDLLSKHLDWIENFLSSFTYIFLTGQFSPKIVFEVRSGVQILIDYWGKKSFSNETLKERLDLEIKQIDEDLTRWRNNTGHRINNKSIDQSHWWWQE